jgi:hypothetical protein
MERTEKMPKLVYWALKCINDRKVAMIYFKISAALSLVIFAAALVAQNYHLVIIFLSPLWYWKAIKWVDNNGTWEIEDKRK